MKQSRRLWKQVLFIVLYLPIALGETKDVQALLDGVRAIGTHANEEEGPTAIAVIGTRAFAVVVGDGGNKTQLPIVAAARFGKGHVIAVSEKGLFGDVSGSPLHDDNKFLSNAITWAAGDNVPAEKTRIKVMQFPDMAKHLESLGYSAVTNDPTWNTSNCDVIVAVVDAVPPGRAKALQDFLRRGGGLVLAASVSHWEDQNTSGETIAEFPGNAVLAPVGILWTDVDVEGDKTGAYAAQQGALRSATASAALDTIRALRTGNNPPAPEVDQAARVLITATGIVPHNDKLFLPELRQVMSGFQPDHYPSARNPVLKSDVLTRIALVLDRRNFEALPSKSVAPYPSGAEFPGSVPSTAPTTTRSIAIDTSHPRWHSTGLYAAPGHLIDVDVPRDVANHDFKIRIGPHTDTLWHLEKWERFPDISRSFPIRNRHTRIASAFGGLIYIEVPLKTPLANFSATIHGGVPAARFVLGETTPEQWAEMRRDCVAPWGEVESSTLILTAPLDELKKLDDPVELMSFWDKILQAQADLAGWPPVPSSPERIVFDQQISAGYLHSGYPIMGPLSLAGPSLSTAYMSKSDDFEGGRWGYYHELGHNHQNDDWTFRGTVEVTVNLFTLYSFEVVNGIPVADNQRGSAEFRKKLMAKINWQQPDFSKLDAFEALVMYEQLEQAFGWDSFKNLFRKYRSLPEAERPKTDLEKRDRWLVEFSRQTGKNLGPFFRAWGLETSPQAQAAVAGLPCWTPQELPVQPCAASQ